MLNKNLKTLYGILFALLISSCAQVQLKDAEWCADLGNDGASCFHTLSDSNRDIPKDVWDLQEIGDDHRYGKVCTSSDSLANWKEAIEKLCYLTKRCTYDAKKKIYQFSLNLQEIENRLRKK